MKCFFSVFVFVCAIQSHSLAQSENQIDSSMLNLIINFGKTYTGTPYKYGSCSASKGFDCSGFLYYIFKMAGYTLPRSSREMAQQGKRVDLTNIQKGDFLFFNTLSSGRISHVGIVSEINDKQIVMLHVSSSRGVQLIDFVQSDYWYSRFVYAKRCNF